MHAIGKVEDLPSERQEFLLCQFVVHEVLEPDLAVVGSFHAVDPGLAEQILVAHVLILPVFGEEPGGHCDLVVTPEVRDDVLAFMHRQVGVAIQELVDDAVVQGDWQGVVQHFSGDQRRHWFRRGVQLRVCDRVGGFHEWCVYSRKVSG